jgi:hypothetical protein
MSMQYPAKNRLLHVHFEMKTRFRVTFGRERVPARSIFLERRDFSVFFWAL